LVEKSKFEVFNIRKLDTSDELNPNSEVKRNNEGKTILLKFLFLTNKNLLL